MGDLAPRLDELWRTLADFIRRHRRLPSMREISQAVSIPSRYCNLWMRALARQGYVKLLDDGKFKLLKWP